MSKSNVKFNEVADKRTGLRLVLAGERVEFVGTADGVYDTTGKKLGDDFEAFKKALGVQTHMRNAADFRRSIDWFSKNFPQLVSTSETPARFSGAQFMAAHQVEAPDSFQVQTAEEAHEKAERIVAAIPAAKAAGADARFLSKLQRWAHGWVAIERRYRQGPDGPRDAKVKGPPAAVLARKGAKRERDRATRMKMRGRKTG